MKSTHNIYTWKPICWQRCDLLTSRGGDCTKSQSEKRKQNLTKGSIQQPQPYGQTRMKFRQGTYIWNMKVISGATLYIIPETVIYDPKQLILYLEKHKITRMLATPSLVEAVLNAKNIPSMETLSLKILYLCGEVVTTKLRERILATVPKVRRNEQKLNFWTNFKRIREYY